MGRKIISSGTGAGVSSRLDVDIDVKYDGSSVTRTVEFVIEGSMASWLRWGMDNIGNATLPSDHLFKQVQGSVAQDLRQNGKVDGAEKDALTGHIDSSTRNLGTSWAIAALPSIQMVCLRETCSI